MNAPTKTCTKCGDGEVPPRAKCPTKWPGFCRRCRVRAAKDKWAAANLDKIKASRAAYNAANSEKRKQQQKDSREKYPETAKRWLADNQNLTILYFRRRQLKQYGITIADYEAMLNAQGGRCAICDKNEPGHGKTAFCVDHDHKTGAVRGLLCQDCNQGLGRFHDEPPLLLAAERYLQRSRGARLVG